VSAHKKHGHHGIGFVFTPEDDLCGVDLDGCLDPETGKIESWAQEIIEELDSYTEISPSGTGVHILLRGKLPEGRNRKGRFEAYDRSRYFTMTGKHLAGTPRAIGSRQEELRRVVERMFGEPSANGQRGPATAPELLSSGLSDAQIIEKASAAENGERFCQLWAGDASNYESQSEADLALCSHVIFWTGGDQGRVEELFRRSGLYRPKWDERHYGDGKTYGQITIEKALEGATEYYAVTDDE
jgi:putative DNA primase/helicase